MTAFFVIALTSVSLLCVGALLTLQTSDSDIEIIALAPSVEVEGIEQLNASAPARAVVSGDLGGESSSDLMFAPAETTEDNPLIPPSLAGIREGQAATETLDAEVITWNVQGAPTTAHALIEAEAQLAGKTVADTEILVSGEGEEVLVAALTGEGGQSDALIAVHATEGGYAVAYLTAPEGTDVDAVTAYQEHVESILFAG